MTNFFRNYTDSRLRVAVVGSREAPEMHCEVLEEAAIEVLRSGGKILTGDAVGVDMAGRNAITRAIDETGLSGHRFGEIHMPTLKNKELKDGDLSGAVIGHHSTESTYWFANTIAALARGSFEGLSDFGIWLHSRNPYQILGNTLKDPVSIVLTSAEPTSRGCKGGTNTALRIAAARNIPIINLQTQAGMELLSSFITGIQDIPLDWNGRLSIAREDPTVVKWGKI